MKACQRCQPSRYARLVATALFGLLVAPAVTAAPPGEPFEELETRVDDLTERVDLVETDVRDIDERLSEVVEVVDVAEAFDMCVRVIEGELGGMPGPHWIFSGCNVHVRAKNLATDAPANGRGNLIVGYNEGRCVTKAPIRRKGHENGLQFPKACLTDAECGDGAVCDVSGRGGSHNLVVGHQHRYPSFGGVLGGRMNESAGRQATAVAGARNEAQADFASVTGGSRNAAANFAASVSGGDFNLASGPHAGVAGGRLNVASGEFAYAGGGSSNEAAGRMAVTVGGGGSGGFIIGDQDFEQADCPNTASGIRSVVVGGCGNEARFEGTAILGGLGNRAEGEMSVISGGADNATGFFAGGSAIGGGRDRIVEGNYDWRAGGKFEDD